MSNIDHNRIALGNEEGLFVVHVTIDGKESLYCPGVITKNNNIRFVLFHSVKEIFQIWFDMFSSQKTTFLLSGDP